jgi:hypothetical protein
MKSKIAITLILLMCFLNLAPPLFAKTEYFDNVYYTILYLLLSFLGLVIPYLVTRLNKWIKRCSIMVGAWFFSGLIIEIINFANPLIVYNSKLDDNIYFKFVVMFTIGIASIITIETWTKKQQKN